MNNEMMLNTGWEWGRDDGREHGDNNNAAKNPHDAEDSREDWFGCSIAVAEIRIKHDSQPLENNNN